MPVRCVQGRVSLCRAAGWPERYKPVSFFGGGLVTQQQAAWEKHQLIGMRCMHMHSQTKQQTNKQGQTHKRSSAKQHTQAKAEASASQILTITCLAKLILQAGQHLRHLQLSTHFFCHASHHHMNRCTFSSPGTCDTQGSQET